MRTTVIVLALVAATSACGGADMAAAPTTAVVVTTTVGGGEGASDADGPSGLAAPQEASDPSATLPGSPETPTTVDARSSDDGVSLAGPDAAAALQAAVTAGDLCRVYSLVNGDVTPVADSVAFPASMAASADAAAAVAGAASAELRPMWDQWAAGLRRAADQLAAEGVTPEVLRRITGDDPLVAAAEDLARWADDSCPPR